MGGSREWGGGGGKGKGERGKELFGISCRFIDVLIKELISMLVKEHIKEIVEIENDISLFLFAKVLFVRLTDFSFLFSLAPKNQKFSI
jgi:hypothetical protein